MANIQETKLQGVFLCFLNGTVFRLNQSFKFIESNWQNYYDIVIAEVHYNPDYDAPDLPRILW